MAKKKIIKHGVPVRFGVSEGAPDNPENGMIYYDITENLFKVYENSAWQILSSRDYAASRLANLDVKQTCDAATTANLSATYSNGSSGVGATLTGAGALGTIDGVTLSVGKRVLVRSQTSAAENGIYTVTAMSPFVLTRATDFDSSTPINGGEYLFIRSGTDFGNCVFVCSNKGDVTLGTTAITFTQISGPARSLQQHYAVGGQITTSGGRNVIVAGTEKLQVEATQGVEITHSLSAGQTLVSEASVSGAVNVGSQKLVIGSDGNFSKINNVATIFPSSASQVNYALANNGAGSLSFANLAVSNLNDILLTSISNQDLIQYDLATSTWLNKAALSQGSTGPIITSSTITTGDITTGDLSTAEGQGITHVLVEASTRIVQEIVPASSGYVDSIAMRIRREDQSTYTTYLYIIESSVLTGPNVSGWFFGTNLGTAAILGISNGILSTTVGVSQTVTWTFTNKPFLESGKRYVVLASNSDTNPFASFSGGLRAKKASNSYALGGAYSYKSFGNYYTLVTMSDNSAADIAMVINLSGTVIPTGVLTTNASGYVDSSLINYNVNLNNNIISGIATPTVSTDLANRAYVDAVSLQQLYNQDVDGSGATLTTDSSDGDLIIAGTERLQVTAASGMSIAQMLIASGSMAAGSLIAGNASMSVSSAGDLSSIQAVSYSFPSSQAAASNHILLNNGSGNLTWEDFDTDQLSDVIVNGTSDFQMIRFDGSSFINTNTVTSGGASDILRADVSGRFASGSLQYNIDFADNILSGVANAVSASDLVSKAYCDSQTGANGIDAITLQTVYENGPVLTTNSTDGLLEIIGSESLKVSASFALADSSDDTKFTRVFYKHGIALSASQSNTILSDLTFSSALYEGCVIEYRMKDNTTGASRVGLLMLSTDGTNTSIADSFAETSPMGVTWAATMSDDDVQILYSTNSTAKTLSAKIKLFA